jgi:polygalacturonase
MSGPDAPRFSGDMVDHWRSRRDFFHLAGFAAACRAGFARTPPGDPPFDIRSFGAVGDGKALDTPAVNAAINAAAGAGGGTVRIPAGTYLCHSVRLKSFVALYLEPGANIQAAPTGGYDPAEPSGPWEKYQDYGHSHWHNSLIYGDAIRDAAILGPGLIRGHGLARGEVAGAGLPSSKTQGVANKTIALKNSYNVTLRDFSILAGGHIGILATGVDNLTIDNLKIDTNRDGINIDACRNVRVTNCSVNSPWDDGICLKSSLALGQPQRPTENVTISNCYVTGGYQLGTMLDGSFRRLTGPQLPTGRIKLGTESNGGFRNITISNCVFESCRGLAMVSVDGGPTEDITITGITMRDLRNAPFFLRLGARLRAPPDTAVGTLRRVIISNLTCDAPANTSPAIIAGIPGHRVEDISIRDVYLVLQGLGSRSPATIVPAEETSRYPEPALFAPLPAQGLFVRHARGLEIDHFEVASRAPDARPVVWLDDVDGANFSRLQVPSEAAGPAFLLNNTRDFHVSDSAPVADTTFGTVAHRVLR